jgi:hypothetical protein
MASQPESSKISTCVTYNVQEHRLALHGAATGKGPHEDDEGSSPYEHVRCRSREFSRQFHVFVQIDHHPYAHGQDSDARQLLTNRIQHVVRDV